MDSAHIWLYIAISQLYYTKSKIIVFIELSTLITCRNENLGYYRVLAFVNYNSMVITIELDRVITGRVCCHHREKNNHFKNGRPIELRCTES